MDSMSDLVEKLGTWDLRKRGTRVDSMAGSGQSEEIFATEGSGLSQRQLQYPKAHFKALRPNYYGLLRRSLTISV
jgi:hypothetical protein